MIHFDCNQPQPGRACFAWHCDQSFQLASLVGLLKSGVSSNPTATRTSLPAPEPTWRDRPLTECRFSPVLKSGSPPRHTKTVAEGQVDVKPARHELSVGQALRITAALSISFNSPEVAWKGMQTKPGLCWALFEPNPAARC